MWTALQAAVVRWLFGRNLCPCVLLVPLPKLFQTSLLFYFISHCRSLLFHALLSCCSARPSWPLFCLPRCYWTLQFGLASHRCTNEALQQPGLYIYSLQSPFYLCNPLHIYILNASTLSQICCHKRKAAQTKP